MKIKLKNNDNDSKINLKNKDNKMEPNWKHESADSFSIFDQKF